MIDTYRIWETPVDWRTSHNAVSNGRHVRSGSMLLKKDFAGISERQ